MTTTDPLGTGPHPAGSPEPEAASASASPGHDGRGNDTQAPARTLTRSRTDRKIAGVCGGLGRYFDIDPLILRIVIAVLTVFGGTGLVLYGAGWLLIPEEGSAESEAERLLRGRGRGSAVMAALAILLGIVLLGGLLSHDAWPAGVVLVVVLGVAYLVSRDRPATPAIGPFPTGPASDAATTAPLPGDITPPPPGAPAPPVFGTPPPPPRPPRRRSMLARLTVSVALLAVGVVVAVTVGTGSEVAARTVAGTILVVLGAGLVVGAWWGHARRLLIPAFIAGVVAVGSLSTPHGPFNGGVGDRRWAPASAAELTSPYRLGLGSADLDLTRVSPGGGTVVVEASVGMGELRVRVPRNVDLVTHAEARAGQIDLPSGGEVDGRRAAADTRDPAAGPSAGVIDLRLNVGFGHVEVRREGI